jgi:hypothetical protein
MNFISIYEMAVKRGYLSPYDLMVTENGTTDLHPSETVILLELTLIQKWLREEHKIYFEIDARQSKNDSVIHRVAASRSIAGMVRRITTFESSVYEDALLNGINEALKLI